MNVKLLSGDVYSLTPGCIQDAKRQLAERFKTSPYSIKLLHPETREEITSLQPECLFVDSIPVGQEYDHFPRLFTRVDGFIYPTLPPKEFREAIQGVDCIILNNPIMYQMVGLFSYMCDHLHPYAYEDYFPMLSYYHIDTEDPGEALEWSLEYKIQNSRHLGVTAGDVERIKGKLFENEE